MWYRNFGLQNNMPIPGYLWGILLPFAVIDLVLRGFALWRSARRGENVWFIFLMVVNSLGVLPLVYLLTHQQNSPKSKKK